jgi:hypothetical protein
MGFDTPGGSTILISDWWPEIEGQNASVLDVQISDFLPENGNFWPFSMSD